MLRIAVVALAVAATNAAEYHEKKGDYAHFECPQGFELQGKETCVKLEQHKADLVCPKGYEQTGKDCIKFFEQPKEVITKYKTEQCKLDYFCPPGYEQQGKECVKKTIVPQKEEIAYHTKDCKLDYFCPPGYESQGKECVKKVVVPQQTLKKELVHECKLESFCPKGYEQIGKECKKEVSVPQQKKENFSTKECKLDYFCPKGYEQQGKECVTEQFVPKQKKADYTSIDCPLEWFCPKGYEQQGKECVAEHVAPKQKNVEYKTHECPLEYFCPKGWEQHGKECKKEVPVPKLKKDNLITKSCPVEHFCPKGTERHGEKECVKVQTTWPVKSCDKKCHSIPCDSKDKYCKETTTCENVCTESCPHGFEQSGKECVKKVFVPTQETCPKGCQNQGKECVTYETTFDFFCPPGTEEKGKDCWKWETTPVLATCPKDCQTSEHKKHSKHDKQECYKVETSESFFCPKGYETHGDKCVNIVKVPQQSLCPKGCSTGYGKKHEKPTCSKTETNWSEFCPKGTEDHGKDCVVIKKTPLIAQCPKHCQTSTGKKHEKSSCFTTDVSYEFFCPKGTEQKGKDCVSWVSAPQIYECPKHCQTSTVGKKHHKKTTCFTVEVQTEEFCPKGTEQQGKDCVTWSKAPKNAVCPKHCKTSTSGKKHESTQCYTLETSTKAFCPKGTEQHGHECVSWSKTMQIAQCPKECQTSSGKKSKKHSTQCFKSLPYTEEFCTKGFESVNGKCEKKDITPARYVCPKGTETFNGLCKSVVTVPAHKSYGKLLR